MKPLFSQEKIDIFDDETGIINGTWEKNKHLKVIDSDKITIFKEKMTFL